MRSKTQPKKINMVLRTAGYSELSLAGGGGRGGEGQGGDYRCLRKNNAEEDGAPGAAYEGVV